MISPENDFMAAKEQEEEVPEALLQVPTPSHTLLGVTGMQHISSFWISKIFKYFSVTTLSLSASVQFLMITWLP